MGVGKGEEFKSLRLKKILWLFKKIFEVYRGEWPGLVNKKK